MSYYYPFLVNNIISICSGLALLIIAYLKKPPSPVPISLDAFHEPIPRLVLVRDYSDYAQKFIKSKLIL